MATLEKAIGVYYLMALVGVVSRLGLLDFYQQRHGQATMDMAELVEGLLAG